MDYKYLDNAYWETDDKSQLKCIKITTLKDGKKKKDILVYNKTLSNGAECPNYKEVVSTFGIEKIDQNTAERKERKDRETREKRAIHEQKKKTAELEQLFTLKLQAFEIDEIKNSPNKALRSKLRRAKNAVEMNALASIIIAQELGLMPNE